MPGNASGLSAWHDAGTATKMTALWVQTAVVVFKDLMTHLRPSVLLAQDDPCIDEGGDPNNPPDEPCELPPIIVPGEDPCDDAYGYWDDYLGKCICYNGEEWGDPEQPCQYSEPDPDPSDPPDGGGAGDGDGDNDPPPPPCGDERDDIIAEYEFFDVNLSPTCQDFTQTASSVYFTYGELSKTNPYSWSIIRAALIAPASTSYGADRWRELYGAPRIVESGYRPPAHNASVDGKPQSRHMYGDALDLRVETRTQAEAQALADAAEAAHAGFVYIGISSIDGNPGWVHADWRYH